MEKKSSLKEEQQERKSSSEEEGEIPRSQLRERWRGKYRLHYRSCCVSTSPALGS
jgi:hypothetical protein